MKKLINSPDTVVTDALAGMAAAIRECGFSDATVADVVRHGIELGTFSGRYDPDKIAILTIAAADGMGIPLSLADPQITAASAAQDVMTALRDMLSPDRGSGLG